MAVKDPQEIASIISALEKAGYPTADLSNDAIAKEHVRYMVGGRVNGLHDEVVMTFEFPEKPGALRNFLSELADRWNISMFHYRNHGADHGKILAGFQVPKGERKAFDEALKKIGYAFSDVTQDAAYRSFLGGND